MKKNMALLLALLLALCACASTPAAPSAAAPESAAEAVPPPAAEAAPRQAPAPAPAQVPGPGPDTAPSWELDAPQNHGMSPQVLAAMHEALPSANVYAVLTAKDGVIIDEYYRDGYDKNSVFALHSSSKSFTSALVGIAIGQGLIGGVDIPLSSYLPQVLELEDTAKHQITLRHLLTHTSGLEWYEWGGGYSNWEEFQAAPNWVEYILGRGLAAQPGTAFNYSTGNTHLLAAALEQATGMGVLEYAKETLFGPLGMESVRWGSDPQGIADGGNGISMTARDAARFGQLYLDGGVFRGRQLIPADWVAASTAVQNAGPGGSTGQYGFSWWVRPFGGYDTFYAFGAWGQYIFVVPQLSLVTVIASGGP